MTTSLALQRNGNRCGHNPRDFKHYDRSESNSAPPKPIETSMRNTNLWSQGETDFLDNLRSERVSKRGIRSERRESLSCVIQCLINYTDLCTMKPTKYNHGGGTSDLNAGLISSMTGISYKRVLRALDHLWEAGYIKIKRHWAFGKDGLIARKLKILKVGKRLFDHLGVSRYFLDKTISSIRKQREIEPTLESEFKGVEKVSHNIDQTAQKHKEQMAARGIKGPQMLKNLLKNLNLRK